MQTDHLEEIRRKEKLLEAQQKAKDLLVLIENNKYLQAGKSEQEISDQIFVLAKEKFGISKHWHKRIVRTGINTVFNYKANPENRIIEENDLVYVDLGPVFEEFEGDIGKTYLLGNDPQKQRLIDDLEKIFKIGKEHYLNNTHQTGAQLYNFIEKECDKAGWLCGNNLVGHIVSEFSHIQLYGDLPENRIWSQNDVPMDEPGKDGKQRYWILEIHLVSKDQKYGGFFEDLLL